MKTLLYVLPFVCSIAVIAEGGAFAFTRAGASNFSRTHGIPLNDLLGKVFIRSKVNPKTEKLTIRGVRGRKTVEVPGYFNLLVYLAIPKCKQSFPARCAGVNESLLVHQV